MLYKFLISSTILCMSVTCAYAKEDAELIHLLNLDIESLANIETTIGSKRLEKTAESPGIISVITRDDIERYGGNDLFDVIRRLPNLDIQHAPLMPSGLGANIRGQLPSGAPNHVLTLLDGRPVRESQVGGWDQAFYRSFPLESVERIEMIRGPGSVLYGTNAFAGVLNIITKKADGWGNQEKYASVGYGSFNTKMSEASYRSYNAEHDFSINGAVKYYDSGGWDYALIDRASVYDSQRLARDAVGGYVNGKYKNFSFIGFRGQTNVKNQGLFALWPFGEHRQQREFVDFGYKQPLGSGWNADVHITYNGFENLATDGSVVADKNNFHDILYEASISGPIFDNGNLIAGFTYDHRSGVLEVGENRFDEALEGYYLQADYKPLHWLKLIGGVQFNRPENLEVAKISPRAGAIVNFTPKIGAKLLYGEAFRAPTGAETRLDIPGIVGDPNLTSETVATTEMQLFYNADHYSSALTVYRSLVKNTIDTGPNPNAPPAITYLNKGKLEYSGIEFEGKAFIMDDFEVQGSITYQKGKDTIADITDVSTAPHLMVKVGGSYKSDDGYTISVFNQYVADTVKYNAAIAPSQKLNPAVGKTNMLTANVSVDINKAFNLPSSVPETTFTLYGDNLLDEDINLSGLPSLGLNTIPSYGGRAIYGRFSVKF